MNSDVNENPNQAAPEAQAITLKMENKVKDQDACVRELGYAWIYMHYLHPDWIDHPKDTTRCAYKQKLRVKKLMMKCAVNWHTQVPQFWEYFYDEIIDEIENMC